MESGSIGSCIDAHAHDGGFSIMLDPVLFLRGIFQFILVMIGAWLIWQMVTSAKGFMTRLFGLIVLVTCALAYYYPDLLGQ